MEALDLKAILLTQIAFDHFGGDVNQAVAAVQATDLHVAEQANAATRAAIAAEAASEATGGGIKPAPPQQ